MKLITYRNTITSAAHLGVVIDDSVLDLKKLGQECGTKLPASMLELIDLGPNALIAIQSLIANYKGVFPIGTISPLANAQILAPIPVPRKNIFGIGLNYTEHVAESAKSLDTSPELPRQPVIFTKPPTTVIGPNQPILHNAEITKQLDWEVELAVIIGKTAKSVSRKDALNYVFGYSVMIDVSARDCRRAGQWVYSKGLDSYAPFGPCIITADEIKDPQNLNLKLSVNGVEKQNGNTSHMLFKVDELIEDISQGMTLQPGDIIATGTPAGVGAGMDPQEFLWPGDIVEAMVEGIGELRHPIVKA